MRKLSKLLSLVLSAVLAVGCFAAVPVTAAAAPDSKLGVYQIKTADDLKWAAENPELDYLLVNDIDLSGEKSWTAIGSEEKPFSGSFNGAGHTVTLDIDMNETAAGTYFAGLFGVVSGTVAGLKTSGSIDAVIYSGCVGGIAACMRGGRIISCESNVDITAEGTAGVLHTGGITGAMRASGIVENCTNNGNLSVKAKNSNSSDADLAHGTHGSAGGIVSFVCDGVGAEITRCINNGNITVTGGADNIGGIVGQTSTDTSATYVNITYCANKGDITVYKLEGERAAGIIGYVKRGSINYCYNTGSIIAYSDMGNTVSRTGYGTYFGIFGYANLNTTNKLEVTYCYNASPAPLEAEICVVRNASHGTFKNYYMQGRDEYERSLNSGNVSSGEAGTVFTDGSDLYKKLSADTDRYVMPAGADYPALYFEAAEAVAGCKVNIQTINAYCHNIYLVYSGAAGLTASVLLKNGEDTVMEEAIPAVDSFFDGEETISAGDAAMYALRMDSIMDDLWTDMTVNVKDSGGKSVFTADYTKDELIPAVGVEVPFEGLPAYPDGSASPVYNCGPGMANDKDSLTDEDSYMTVISGTSQSSFTSYVRRLISQGFEEADCTQIGSNIHYALEKDGKKYYIYYTAATQQVRIIEDNSTSVYPDELYSDAVGSGDTEIYLYSIDYTHGEGQTTKADYWQIDCGALIIVKLADNSLFVIDSGHERQSSNTAMEALLDFMREITGTKEGEKVNIRSWFFSHAHGDHVYLCHAFVDKYHDYIDLQSVIHNFPSYQVIRSGYDGGTFLMKDSINTYFPDCDFVKLHTGQKFSMQGVDFEILFTHEDGVGADGKNGVSDFNSTSTVFRMTVGGKTFAMLGDASEFAQSVMLRMYTSDDLKSDAVQTGHHGYNNLTSLYNAIKAPFIMYSNSEANAGLNSGNREKYLGAVNAAPDPVVVFSDPDTVKITVEDGEISYSYLPSYREGLYFDIPELAESLVPDSNEPAVDINEVLENNNFIDKVIDKSINGTLSESVNEPCSRALDGKTDTKFCTKTVPATIAWSMKEPVKVSHYVVYSANDNSKNPGRNPEKWVLCGSNDKENWTVIDAVSSANMPDTDFTGVAFDVDSPAEYQYYVFKVFSTAGAEVLQYSEIALYGDVNLAGFAKAVDEQIAALGEITLEKKEQVEAARAAYEALDEQTKAMVTKLDMLVAAEEAIVDLTAAVEVEKMISELGEITSLDQKDAVEAARAAFDKLTEAQQELVKNENVLKDAEAAIEKLENPDKPVIKGDVDDNGVVNVSDIMTLKNLIMGSSWTPEQLKRGDMNNDGTLTVGDMLSIKSIIMAG